jgi:hypothetical protein
VKSVPSRESALSPQQFKRRIVHDYFVRVHMGLILAAVIASGVLTSRLLLELHVHSMRLRYPLAILGSYLVFFLLVRMWIWYVCRRKMRLAALGNIDTGSIDIGSGGGSSSPSVRFGGGSSGGAGASDVWGGPATSNLAPVSQGGSHSGGSSWNCDIDLDDDWLVVILVVALVAAIVVAAGYLIYVAPTVLPEAAWQAGLASTLTRVTTRVDHDNWVTSLLRASAITFAVVFLLAGAVGWVAHHHCPHAVKLIEVFHCPGH